MADIPNSRIGNALGLLRERADRQVYEWGGADGKGGTGRYFVSYPPKGPRLGLSGSDVATMVDRGWIISVQKGMYEIGRLPCQ